MCDFLFYWQVQKDLAKLQLRSKLWEEAGYDIFLPAKIMALTFLAASLRSTVTLGLHLKHAANSIYCLIPGCVTQPSSDCLSEAHLHCERKLSWEAAHLLQKSEWRVGRALLFWQAVLESCLTFHSPWNLPFLPVTCTSRCYWLLLVLVKGLDGLSSRWRH